MHENANLSLRLFRVPICIRHFLWSHFILEFPSFEKRVTSGNVQYRFSSNYGPETTGTEDLSHSQYIENQLIIFITNLSSSSESCVCPGGMTYLFVSMSAVSQGSFSTNCLYFFPPPPCQNLSDPRKKKDNSVQEY